MKTQDLLSAPAKAAARKRASGTGRGLEGSPAPGLAKALQRIGVAADHGGVFQPMSAEARIVHRIYGLAT